MTSKFRLSDRTAVSINSVDAVTISVFEARCNDYSFLPGYPISPLYGLSYGFSTGGSLQVPYAATQNIDRFPFATSTASSSFWGNLVVQRWDAAGQSSSTHGYHSGGFLPPYRSDIDKFSFASPVVSTAVGNLTTLGQTRSTGQSSSTTGYTSGGRYNIASPVGFVNTICSFPFSTDTNASDVGDLTRRTSYVAGQSSTTHGYTSGGYPTSNTIDKFPFASNANATDVGDLTLGRYECVGQSSTTHGYTTGGSYPVTNVIDKFSFAADGNATDVGDLTVRRNLSAGQSSSTHGYTTGGYRPPNIPSARNTIDRFPFASDSNAADVGDLYLSRFNHSGQQD